MEAEGCQDGECCICSQGLKKNTRGCSRVLLAYEEKNTGDNGQNWQAFGGYFC